MSASANKTALIGSDPEVFEAFYREHVRAVRNFLARRTCDPFEAADLTADVFLAALDACSSYDPSRGQPRAWLIGIARNVLLADQRRRSRDLRVFSRISGRALLDEDAIRRADEIIDSQREARSLHAALADLPDGERAVLELVALDGLSVGEAAQVLGLRAGAARARLHRARNRIRESTQPVLDAQLEGI